MTPDWLLTGAVLVLGGVVKGVTGMGLPTVATGLPGALTAPLATAARGRATAFLRVPA